MTSNFDQSQALVETGLIKMAFSWPRDDRLLGHIAYCARFCCEAK